MTELAIRSRKRLAFFAALILLDVTVAAGAYLATVVWRSSEIYEKPARWSGAAYRPDDRYGHFPNEGALAHHMLGTGERIPVRFDANGFRVPVNPRAPDSSKSSRILFLGDSFTHGYGVPADETFAHLTAENLGASEMNAGGSGWGLSQMVLRAREVIPASRPDLVVAQYSSWLASRSTRYYRHSVWGLSPQPFFYDDAGRIDIHAPLFRPVSRRLPIADYAGGRLLPFVWTIGIPLYAHDDYVALEALVGRELGWIPPPLDSEQRAVDYAFEAIRAIAATSGAELLVLSLPRSIDDVPRHHLERLSVPVVSMLEPLEERLPEPTQAAWATDYYIWGGVPPRILDRHPSARMHGIIADVLSGAIRERGYLSNGAEKSSRAKSPASG